MTRPTCSPRAENLLEIAQRELGRGALPKELAQRFASTLLDEPQRGHQDFGRGLCGRRGSRLARSLGEVSCQDCLILLGQLPPEPH